MAARLMCHPEADRNMLCDEKTFNLCQNEFKFSNLGETKVKGKSQPIGIFRPMSELKEPLVNTEKITENVHTMIGRNKEKSIIRSFIGKLTNRDTSSILLFEADGGQGLSTLFAFVKQEGASRGCHYL
jgi:hypothetical protein